MAVTISVIIPVHNGAGTLGSCLGALYSSQFLPHEVIVADDCSTDSSAEIIRSFPCRYLSLERRSGASVARNAGARLATGEVLFFIDADCVVREDTLHRVAESFQTNSNSIIGGSYAPVAFDDSFFSTFQSVFINYSELKNIEPDYVASHAMVIGRRLFEESGGFPEDFLPIIEDVEFSHRLRRSGVRLLMDNSILVSHIFGFNLGRSFRNAYRKARYWTSYSLGNRDITGDSGTASRQLKASVISSCLLWLFSVCYVLSLKTVFIILMTAFFLMTLTLSSGLIRAFFRTKGGAFGLLATLYYALLYPLPVAVGGLSGLLLTLQGRRD